MYSTESANPNSYTDYNQGGGGGYNYSQGNDYGGASQFAGNNEGGGFIMEAGLSQGQSPSSGQRERKQTTQSLLATSVKRLNDADYVDSKFMIDGKDVKQVTFVGCIVTVEAQAMNTTYLVGDGSGQIRVQKYSDQEGDNSNAQPQLREGMYVRVFGNLRSFSGNKSVVAFQLSPIQDFNEITYHLLETIHSHLLVTRGAPQSGGQANQANLALPRNNLQNQQQATNNSYIDASGGGDGQFTPLQSRVLAIFSRDNSDAGSSIQTVCNAMEGVATLQIRQAVDFLTEEGHLYSTIDDDHFKATHSMM